MLKKIFFFVFLFTVSQSFSIDVKCLRSFEFKNVFCFNNLVFVTLGHECIVYNQNDSSFFVIDSLNGKTWSGGQFQIGLDRNLYLFQRNGDGGTIFRFLNNKFLPVYSSNLLSGFDIDANGDLCLGKANTVEVLSPDLKRKMLYPDAFMGWSLEAPVIVLKNHTIVYHDMYSRDTVWHKMISKSKVAYGGIYCKVTDSTLMMVNEGGSVVHIFSGDTVSDFEYNDSISLDAGLTAPTYAVSNQLGSYAIWQCGYKGEKSFVNLAGYKLKDFVFDYGDIDTNNLLFGMLRNITKYHTFE